MANLHAIQEILNDPLIKCKLPKDVRWLSHDNAIKALVRCLPSILVSLDREASENGEPTAHGLFKFMKCYKFVACLYLLSDVLPHLSRLSRIFQKEDIDFFLVQPCLIKEYMHCPGPNLSKVDDVLVTDLKDFQIIVSDSQKDAFKSNIQAIIDQLYNRFPHVELIDALSIFDPCTLPSDEKELVTHGRERLKVLTTIFGGASNCDIDIEDCTSEWECLKRLIHNN